MKKKEYDAKKEYDVWYKKGAHWEVEHPSKSVGFLLPELKKEDRVLDLGCGSGRDCLFLARRGFEVTGIDISDVAIQKAKEKAEKEDLDVKFDVGNIENLPYKNKSFDKTISAYTISDTNIKKVVKENHRVLKDGGKAYLLIIIRKEFLETKKRVIDMDKDFVIKCFSKYFDIVKEELIRKIDETSEDEPAHLHENLVLILKKK